MVFSSIPAYLDPSNWQQQQSSSEQIIGGSSSGPQQPAATPLHPHGNNNSIRPGSMSERARLANMPIPETSLKCPRCDSTNTKFCYFNNYSLSQPRHFCKTCRRYWTRGGALRNVPVGGGCRRNKRSSTKSNTSKSPVDRQQPAITTTNICVSQSNTPQILPSLPFMSPLTQFTDNFMSNEMALNVYSTGISSPMVTTSSHHHQILNFNPSGVSGFLGGGGGEGPWRLQQFPFLGGGLDPPSSPAGMYQFQGGETSHMDQLRPPKICSSLMNIMSSTTQVSTCMKMEGNPQELHLSSQFLGENWSNSSTTPAAAAAATPAWTDLSTFSSSSTNN